MGKIEIVEEWFRLAKMDLDLANHAMENMYPRPIEIICYHCQQSVEKYLKGYLIDKGINPPRTHDLETLNDKCMAVDNSYNEIYDECEELVDYGVAVRYPYERELIESDATSAIESAQKVQKFVTSKFKDS